MVTEAHSWQSLSSHFSSSACDQGRKWGPQNKTMPASFQGWRVASVSRISCRSSGTAQKRMAPNPPPLRRAPVLSPAAGALVRFLREEKDRERLVSGLASFVRQKGSEEDLMSCIMELRRQLLWPRVVEVCEWLKDEGIAKPDVNFFNILMDSYGKTSQPQKAKALFDSLTSKYACIPSTVSFNVLLAAFCRAGLLDEARQLFTEMRQRGYAPEVVTMNTMLEVEGKARNVEGAEKLLCDMRSTGVTPTTNTYTLIINIYARECMVEKAEEMFKSMYATFCLPNLQTITALIHAYAGLGMTSPAEETFANIPNLGFVPDVHAYNALLEAHCRGDSPTGAREAFEAMKASECSPNLATFNILIDSFARQGLWEDAEKVLGDMQAARIRPSRYSQMLILSAYANAGLPEKISAHIEMLEKSGKEPDIAALNSLLVAYGQVGQIEEMQQLYEKMSGQPCFELSTVNTIIRAYGEAGFLEKAEKEFEGIDSRGMTRNADSWTSLIWGYSKRRLLRKCVSLFLKMTESGVRPDGSSRKLLLSACRSPEQIAEVQKMLRNLDKKKKKGV